MPLGSTPETWCPPTTSDSTSGGSTGLTGPPGTSSKLYPVTPSALCSMGWRPIMITGLIRDLLIRHFATPLHIEEPDLRHLVWREDERTGILIESIHRWRGDLVEKRPAVIIKQNGRQNLRLGIKDSIGATEQGHLQFQTFWIGSHTLFCIHGSGAGTEILATEVQRELTQFHPIITEKLGLFRWQVTEVGGVSEVEEARESFAIPVTVGWCYTEVWQLELESLKLRKTPLSILLDGALVNELK